MISWSITSYDCCREPSGNKNTRFVIAHWFMFRSTNRTKLQTDKVAKQVEQMKKRLWRLDLSTESQRRVSLNICGGDQHWFLRVWIPGLRVSFGKWHKLVSCVTLCGAPPSPQDRWDRLFSRADKNKQLGAFFGITLRCLFLERTNRCESRMQLCEKHQRSLIDDALSSLQKVEVKETVQY